jgi:hypothetical protein
MFATVMIGVAAWRGFGGDGGNARITWSRVSWSNLEEFRAQLAHDLPAGTSQQAVESYLVREGIPFDYDFQRYPSYRKPIVVKKDLPADRTNWFDGGMQLYVVFDHEGAVAELEFRQQRI